MQLEQLEITAFGQHQNMLLDFTQKQVGDKPWKQENLHFYLERQEPFHLWLWGPNESGKSTFLYCLYVLFYGIGKRGKNHSLYTKYQPWEGDGLAKMRLRFQHQGKSYDLIRKVGKSAQSSSFELRTQTGEIVSLKKGEEVGEYLFGLSRESFLQAVFLGHEGGQKHWESTEAEPLLEKIFALSSHLQNDLSVEQAEQDLREYKKSLEEPKTKRSKLSALQVLKKREELLKDAYLRLKNYEQEKKQYVEMEGDLQRRIQVFRTLYKQKVERLTSLQEAIESRLQPYELLEKHYLEAQALIEEIRKQEKELEQEANHLKLQKQMYEQNAKHAQQKKEKNAQSLDESEKEVEGLQERIKIAERKYQTCRCQWEEKYIEVLGQDELKELEDELQLSCEQDPAFSAKDEVTWMDRLKKLKRYEDKLAHLGALDQEWYEYKSNMQALLFEKKQVEEQRKGLREEIERKEIERQASFLHSSSKDERLMKVVFFFTGIFTCLASYFLQPVLPLLLSPLFVCLFILFMFVRKKREKRWKEEKIFEIEQQRQVLSEKESTCEQKLQDLKKRYDLLQLSGLSLMKQSYLGYVLRLKEEKEGRLQEAKMELDTLREEERKHKEKKAFLLEEKITLFEEGKMREAEKQALESSEQQWREKQTQKESKLISAHQALEERREEVKQKGRELLELFFKMEAERQTYEASLQALLPLDEVKDLSALTQSNNLAFTAWLNKAQQIMAHQEFASLTFLLQGRQLCWQGRTLLEQVLIKALYQVQNQYEQIKLQAPNLPFAWTEYELREALRLNEEEKQKVEKEVELCEKCLFLLQESKERIHKKTSPHLSKYANLWISRFTQNTYKNIFISITGDVKVYDSKHQKYVDVQNLSRGTLEQVYLAIRLAVLDVLDEEGTRLPLWLDDAFVHYDPARRKATLESLRSYLQRSMLFISTYEPRTLGEA